MFVSKIISGGQTGVDRGAIEAAHEMGFPYGGLVPKGRRAEDVQVPDRFDQMVEAPFESYVYRTEQNVRNSDCTLIISRPIRSGLRDLTPPRDLAGGTLKTFTFTLQYRKPCLAICRGNVDKVIAWLVKVSEKLQKESLILNVAGPRESKAQGIEASTRLFIKRLIAEVQKGENKVSYE